MIMKQYKLEKKTLYFAEGPMAPVHFVPTIHWDLYLEYRKNIPNFCRIFDTIMEAELIACSQ